MHRLFSFSCSPAYLVALSAVIEPVAHEVYLCVEPLQQHFEYYENSVAILDIQRHLPYLRGFGIYHLAALRIAQIERSNLGNPQLV